MSYEIRFIFDRLFAFYKVATITELAQCLGMSQPAVTNWERRNSISAIKKRCRELGIYDEIFGDIVVETLNKEKEDERKNSIDEDTMFHIQNLFTIAKRKDLLKELKTELSMMYLKYSTYDKDSKNEDEKNIFSDKTLIKDHNKKLEKDYENWSDKKAMDYETNRLIKENKEK